MSKQISPLAISKIEKVYLKQVFRILNKFNSTPEAFSNPDNSEILKNLISFTFKAKKFDAEMVPIVFMHASHMDSPISSLEVAANNHELKVYLSQKMLNLNFLNTPTSEESADTQTINNRLNYLTEQLINNDNNNFLKLFMNLLQNQDSTISQEIVLSFDAFANIHSNNTQRIDLYNQLSSLSDLFVTQPKAFNTLIHYYGRNLFKNDPYDTLGDKAINAAKINGDADLVRELINYKLEALELPWNISNAIKAHEHDTEQMLTAAKKQLENVSENINSYPIDSATKLDKLIKTLENITAPSTSQSSNSYSTSYSNSVSNNKLAKDEDDSKDNRNQDKQYSGTYAQLPPKEENSGENNPYSTGDSGVEKEGIREISSLTADMSNSHLYTNYSQNNSSSSDNFSNNNEPKESYPGEFEKHPNDRDSSGNNSSSSSNSFNKSQPTDESYPDAAEVHPANKNVFVNNDSGLNDALSNLRISNNSNSNSVSNSQNNSSSSSNNISNSVSNSQNNNSSSSNPTTESYPGEFEEHPANRDVSGDLPPKDNDDDYGGGY